MVSSTGGSESREHLPQPSPVLYRGISTIQLFGLVNSELPSNHFLLSASYVGTIGQGCRTTLKQFLHPITVSKYIVIH